MMQKRGLELSVISEVNTDLSTIGSKKNIFFQYFQNIFEFPKKKRFSKIFWKYWKKLFFFEPIFDRSMLTSLITERGCVRSTVRRTQSRKLMWDVPRAAPPTRPVDSAMRCPGWVDSSRNVRSFEAILLWQAYWHYCGALQRTMMY